jgi:glutamine synthetase
MKPHAGLPGAATLHQSLSDGQRNLFYDAASPARKMGRLFEIRRQPDRLHGLRADALADHQRYGRLVDGFWAPVKPTWGLDNHRQLPDCQQPRRRGWKPAAQGADV